MAATLEPDRTDLPHPADLDDQGGGCGTLTPEAIEAAIRHIALGAHDREEDYVRISHVRLYIAASRKLRMYLHAKPEMAHLGAPMPSNFVALHKDLRRRYGYLLASHEERRKERAFRLQDRLAEVEEIGFLRYHTIAQVAAAARRHAQTAEQEGRACFSLAAVVMEPDGTLHPGAQLDDWVLWRRKDYVTSLKPGRSLRRNKRRVPKGKPVVNPAEDTDFVLEWAGTRPSIGSKSFEHFFVTLFRFGVLSSPAHLPPGIKAERHRIKRDWRVADPYPSRGMMRFGQSDRALVTESIAKGRVIVPIFRLEHAMGLAQLGMRSVRESLCREHEFRQQQYRRSMWPTPEAGDAEVGFLAYKKQSRFHRGRREMDFFPVTQETHDEAFELAKLNIARWHPSGKLPDMKPAPEVMWKCDPAPFVFACGSRHLVHPEVQCFLSTLLVNLGERFLFHDFRHAESGNAFHEGASMMSLMRQLKHTSEDKTAYYAQRTPAQLVRFTGMILERRRAQMADRIARMAA